MPIELHGIIPPATIKMPPTSRSWHYTVILEGGSELDIIGKHIYDSNPIPAFGKPSQALGFFKPGWLKSGQKINLLIHHKYCKGYLSLDNDNFWEFVLPGKDGQITKQESLNKEYWIFMENAAPKKYYGGNRMARDVVSWHISTTYLLNMQAMGNYPIKTRVILIKQRPWDMVSVLQWEIWWTNQTECFWRHHKTTIILAVTWTSW